MPTSIALTASLLAKGDEWVLDSGCTFHITPRREVLSQFEEFEGNKVLMGNNTHCMVKGQGTVTIDNPDGTVVTLSQVRYIPDMGRNLISFGQLEQSGCKYTGAGFKVEFFRGDQKVLTGQYDQGLYYLQGTVRENRNKESCNVVDTTYRWHSRLAHMSQSSMEALARKGYLKKEEVKSLGFCEACAMGKSHKLSFPKAKHSTKGILDYVHSDLWGSPNVTPSLSGCKYFLTFIDDYSRKVWIYFLRTKDEAFQKFEEWKILVENQTQRRLKCLRTDNGLEFCNNAFDKICKDTGVKRHKTCPYTPQQNGVSERMNRTIMDKVRSMLHETGLGAEFWAEAASTAVYVINRSPGSAINFDIPEELWSGSEPRYEHLRRFGCVSYVHTVADKISPRATKGVLLGYALGTKGYRVWLLDEEKVVISKDVVFNEEKLYKQREEVTKVTIETEKPTSHKKKVSFKEVLEEFEPENETEEESSVRGGVSMQKDPINLSDSSDSEEEDELATDEAGEDLSDYILARDRIRRKIKAPSKFGDTDLVAYALASAEAIEVEEPKSYEEARRSKDWGLWNGAMSEEMVSHDVNQTWELTDKPRDQKVIGCKWVYKYKPGIPGVEEPRHKGRLVAKGFAQVEGIDYNEVFAPVVKHVSIRLLLSAVVNFDMELEQMDVKTAFLHGILQEKIYMSQPEGFVKKGQEEKVCLLKKALYGLKQSPREWNHRFDDFMTKKKYIRSQYDPCVYLKGKTVETKVYLLLYVDDILIASQSKMEVDLLKKLLRTEFEMKDLGPARRILGMDILRDRRSGVLRLSQEKYLEQVLKTFGMQDASSVQTPIGSQFKLKAVSKPEEADQMKKMENVPYASAVGSLMYAMVGSRPDLAYGLGLVSRYMGKPGTEHWAAVKWMLRYIKGAASLSLLFTKGSDFQVRGYCDSDYASDRDRSRSITGFVFTVGGNTVSWRSCLQKVVALSTTEAEYISLSESSREAVWLKGICEELGFKQQAAEIYCDSQSAIYLAKNSMFHERTKHVRVKYNFIRELVAHGFVKVLKVHTSENPADALTKVLPGEKFSGHVKTLNISRA